MTTATLKLDLNVKEWIALYGLLERQVPNPDKNLAELHNKMRAQLIRFIDASLQSRFDQWFAQAQEQVNELAKQQVNVRADVLTADDAEAPQAYPRRSPAEQKPHHQGGKRKRR